MPSEQLRNVVAAMTVELAWLANVWLVAIAGIAVALVAGWRPRVYQAALLLVVPALSVAVIAFARRDVFDGASFTLLAAALVAATIGNRSNVEGATSWGLSLGVALILYGAWSPLLVDAPTYRAGIAPGPTLAVLAGFTLVADGLGSAWPSIALALWTGVYAVVGVFVHGRWLEAGLLVAAVALVGVTPRLRWDERPRTPLGRTGTSARPTSVVADVATGRML